jgi:Leucine-rich repeat (LRR) protein
MFEPPPDTITITDTRLESIQDLSRLQVSGLKVVHNRLRSLDSITLPPTLTYLSMTRNILQTDGWPTAPHPNIKTLIADNNEIRFIGEDFSHAFPSLEHLSLSNNNIQDTDFLRHCTNLKTLRLDNNNIITLNHLPSSLEELIINDCVLHMVQSRLPDNIQNIQMNGNRLKFGGLPLYWGKALRSLDLSKNDINRFPRNLPDSLETLSIQHNQITSLPNKLPASLRFLNITKNRIRTIPEYERKKPLQCLLASHNQLTNDTKPSWSVVFHAVCNWTTAEHHILQKKILKFWRQGILMKRLRNYSRCRIIKYELLMVAMQPSRCLQIDAIQPVWV